MNAEDLKKLELTINRNVVDENVAKEVLEIIAGLPQLEHIKLENAEAWIESVTNDPSLSYFGIERVAWHAKRLGGFGGSDIGTLISDKFGVHDPFSSPRKLLLEKLMVIAPEHPTKDTLRGSLLEAQLDTVAVERLKAGNPSFRQIEPDITADEEHPWLVGNPDLVYEVNGNRVINDYKIPGSDKAKETLSGHIPFGYIAQQHHYHACLNDGQKNPKFGLIVYDFGFREAEITKELERGIQRGTFNESVEYVLDVAKRTISDEKKFGSNNIHGASMGYISLPYSQKIMDAIFEEGDKYWDMVINGDVPKYKASPKIEIDDDVLFSKAEAAMKLRGVSQRAKERADELVKEIQANVGERLPADNDKAIKVGPVGIGKPSIGVSITDRKAAVNLAKEYGISASVYRPVNDALLIKQLELQEDREDLVAAGVISTEKKNPRISFPRKGSNMEKEYASEIEGLAEGVIEPVISDIQEEQSINLD